MKMMFNKKEYMKKYNRYYRENNKEKMSSYKKLWQMKNNERLKIKKKAYYISNKKKINQKVMIWKLNNIEKTEEYQKQYRKNNKKTKEYQKQYRKKNIEKAREYYKEYRKRYESKQIIKICQNRYFKKNNRININFTIKYKLRTRMRIIIRNYFNKGLLPNKVDKQINWKEVCEHLDKTKPDNWQEYHIDHIKPLCSYDLTNQEELRAANHYTNLQWLTPFENLSKGGRY